jgi:hypothetical protein
MNLHHYAYDVTCPYCAEPPRQPCRNTMHGSRPIMTEPHRTRLHYAEDLAAPLEGDE